MPAKNTSEKGTFNMTGLEQKIDNILDVQNQILQRLAAYELSQAELKALAEKHERALYPNGRPGALQEIASLKSRMTMVFTIGGALYAILVLIFGIVMDKVLTLLTELAKLALAIH